VALGVWFVEHQRGPDAIPAPPTTFSA